MSALPPISAVIVAGGSGSRFGGSRPKQLALLAGKPVLSHTLAVFEASPDIFEIIAVLPPDWLEIIQAEAVSPYNFQKVKCVAGGASRTESTRRGFEASGGDLLLIHDGVRPLLPPGLIRQVAEAALDAGAALAAVPVRDTLKEVAGGLVRGTVERGRLWQAQTPQGFRREILAEAFKRAAVDGREPTDDVALVEALGLQAKVVEGSLRNLKITAREDLDLAEALIQAGQSTPARPLSSGMPRVGQGYDLHRLVEGRPLFLACVEIPFERGLLGHSDADVMSHALADALLGAACLGDIGEHFPDNDPRWQGASGAVILAGSMAKLRATGFELLQADLTLIGERPKISPYRQAMREAVGAALGVSPGIINIKATTTEGLGPTGEGLALAALATAVIVPS